VSQIVKVKGLKVTLDGEDLIMPPLSLGALEQLGESLATYNGDVRDKAQVAVVIDVAHSALKRNYPDMTREQVAEKIGLENMQDVMEAAMDVSGLKRKEREAAEAAAGEAQPAL
jgi:hypothetical protein